MIESVNVTCPIKADDEIKKNDCILPVFTCSDAASSNKKMLTPVSPTATMLQINIPGAFFIVELKNGNMAENFVFVSGKIGVPVYDVKRARIQTNAPILEPGFYMFINPGHGGNVLIPVRLDGSITSTNADIR